MPHAMKKPSFDTIWGLELDWFERPNYHRGGWSGVLKWSTSQGDCHFIKKQENYTKRTWRHPFAGVLTASYEHSNIKRLSALSIPTPKVYFFSERRCDNRRQALLVTENLEGFLALDVWLIEHAELYQCKKSQLAKQLAELLAKLHRSRLAHCALYPKHIFVKFDSDSFDLCLIDLEKLRSKPCRILCTMHDLNKLNRHLVGVSYYDRCHFLKHYLREMCWQARYAILKTFLWKKFLKP